MRNILLIEPNYKNKFPPIGLMKLATYYRRQGDNVVFYKGNLNDFVVRQITNDCLKKLFELDNSIDWNFKTQFIFQYIKTRKSGYLEKIEIKKSNFQPLIKQWLEHYKNYYHKGIYKTEPKWDKVLITTLFTFYWKITIETIEFAKNLVKNSSNIMVGGIMATILADEIEKETGIKPHRGVLNTPGQLDKGNKDIIDELPLDYSILDEIEYKYPDSNAYYSYSTRGCIRKCSFCAVPTLEPTYYNYLPLKQRLTGTTEKYGEQRNLLLMDNNVLASERFSEIIDDIKSCGFAKNAVYYEPNHYEIAIKNLKDSTNDNAYIRKIYFLIAELENKIQSINTKQKIYEIRETNKLLLLETTTKENLLKTYPLLTNFFKKSHKKSPKQRFIDFNQGVDARLFTEENTKLLSEIAIRPLRIAFDDMKTYPKYDNAIRLSAKAGIKYFSNYLLYNFKDKPIELYQRLKINIDLCDELDINIYSFPMKFHPIRGEFSHNRDFIGEHWNRKYIRAVQAILNSTKGKIGRDSNKSESFFGKAFGHSEDEFL
ncbi:MAG: hypothetical protein LBT56_04005, partial [Prevotellaceae bacterium]|nr:hypothetical protein [Prevotellaceae bacterium]